MKVLFTADLHIRLGQKNIPREWAKQRYRTMFAEIDRVYKEHNCDVEVHGGDIFDRLPSLEELAVYFDYVALDQDKPIMVFDGNHEATKKKHTFLHLLKNVLEEINPHALVLTEPLRLDWADFIPYTHIKEKNLKQYKTGKILFTHVRAEIPPHVVPEIDLDELDPWDVVFAGDLHSHTNSQRNIVYPGSPVTVTFHRNEVDTGVIVLDTETGSWEWVKIQVPQLIRKTIEDPEDMVKTEYNHTIYELVGNMTDLAKIDKDVDILDKKLVKYESEAALDLTDLSIEDEIFVYLQDIMQFETENIQRVLKVYNDNIKGIDLE